MSSRLTDNKPLIGDKLTTIRTEIMIILELPFFLSSVGVKILINTMSTFMVGPVAMIQAIILCSRSFERLKQVRTM